jgi:hypothetical protein
MVIDVDAVYAVDLYADVLVGADGASYQVKDVLELEEATAGGLLSKNEYRNACRGLDRLIGLIGNGELVSFLDKVFPFGPSSAGPGLPMARKILEQVPQLQPRHRPTWEPKVGP